MTGTITFPRISVTFTVADFADLGHLNNTVVVDSITYSLFEGIFAAQAKETLAALADVGSTLVATSTTSETIGAGSKALTIQASKGLVAGNFVKVTDAAVAANWMLGAVDTYDSVTGALTFTVASGDFSGTGTKTSWNVALSGPRGPAGDVSTDGNGDLLNTTGSMGSSGADNDWAAGGNRALFDLDVAVGRFGATAGGGSAVTSEWWSNGIKIWSVDTAGALTVDSVLQSLTSRISWVAESAHAAVKQWLDQTEDLAAGGTLDTGWAQTGVTATADQAAAPNGLTVMDKLAASGSGEHYVMTRRGSLDGTYSDIYTLSFYAKAGTTDKVEGFLRADSTGDGYAVKFDLGTGLVGATGVSGSGTLVASGIVDEGGGIYRCYLTVDMSAGTGNSLISVIHLNDSSGNRGFTAAGSPEDAYFWGAMVNGGTLADYVPNTATSGQTYGFTLGAADYDVGTHTLTTDTILNIEPAPAGTRRFVEIDLTQDGTGGWDVTPLFDHATTNLIEMNTKPIFTSQAAAKRTRLIAEVAETFARVWYEVEP